MIQRVFAQHAGRARPHGADHRARRRRLVRAQDPQLRRRAGDRGGGDPARPPRQVHRRPAGVVRVRHPRARELRQGAHRREQVGRDPGLRHRRAVGRRRLFAVSAHQRARGHPGAQRHGRALPAQALPRRAPPWSISTSRRPRSTAPSAIRSATRWASTWSTGRPRRSGIDADRDAPPQRLARRRLSRRSRASGIKLKDLSHQRCIDALVERMRYAELRAGAGARCASKGIHRGIGIACFIKGTAPGPHGYYGIGGAPISLQDACVIKLEPNGGVICAVGVTEQGQGTDTVMGQIAAAALGVPMESVRVISGDTDAMPYGGGTYGSRAAAIGGEAVYQAARDLRAGDPRASPACCCRPTPRALDIVDGDGGRSRRRRQAHAARRDRPHRPLPAGRAAQQRAARAVAHAPLPSGSTTSTSSPTASTAPTSRSTPTPASSAC